MQEAYKYKPRFVDIRIKPPGARRPKDEPQRCDWAECNAPGVCRAPKGPDNLGEFYMFCPAHAAEYNRNWDFFAGMKEADVVAFQREAAHGHRPTWGMGVQGDKARVREAAARSKSRWRDAFADPLGLFRGARGEQPEAPKRKRRGRLETQALETLGLPEDTTPEDIRARYKTLVKQLHPDSNGGDRSNEDRLRKVIRAYKVLRKNGAA